MKNKHFEHKRNIIRSMLDFILNIKKIKGKTSERIGVL